MRHRDGREIRTAAAFLSEVILGEWRALQVDSDEAGGYLLVDDFLNELLIQERATSVMRQICRVLPPIEGDAVGIPSQESALSDATWTNELGDESADSTSPFGKRELHPHPLMKRIRISRKLFRRQTYADQWVTEAIANALAAPQETAYFQGNGSGEALGILTDAAAGNVGTTTTESTGAVVWDDLVKWAFSLDARFQAQARIITTPNFVKALLFIKNGDGHPIFSPWTGKMFNIPVFFSSGMPTAADDNGALTAGAYAAIVGDFKAGYWIQDGDVLDLMRLTELYAESNEVGFNATQYVDGAPVIPTAFQALKIKS